METTPSVSGGDRFQVGMAEVDAALRGGLARSGVHEIHAEAHADGPSALGFASGLSIRAAPRGPWVWVVQSRLSQETGQPHGPGLHELGLDPRCLVMVQARHPDQVLAAAEDALRNPAVGATLISLWGETPSLNLTSLRRLTLAAAEGRTTGFLVRIGAQVVPGAVETRWRLRSVLSQALEANAPGGPTFSVSLLRDRRGARPQDWIMEWSREDGCFRHPAPISGRVVSLSSNRQAGPVTPLRRTG